ncbi:DUF4407 domain-containing protein [Amycolatopsis kentuckyensis]|uniref:DUF4407 domain-containing protein n=1 Tax=Amycolatopsis kentuckyensis TaxID=218823 RepID=UPI00356AEC37
MSATVPPATKRSLWLRARTLGVRRHLFSRIAGVNPAESIAEAGSGELLPSDRSRYAVMGFAVCLTAAFSTVSMPIALSLAAGAFNPVFLLFGLLWGLFVFNLDRWVVSSVDYRLDETGTRDAWQRVLSYVRGMTLVATRLAIAALIGLSISEPIVMLIFDTEITTWISDRKPGRRAQITEEVNKAPEYALRYASQGERLERAKTAVESATRDVGAANAALDAEEGGGGGTKHAGQGRRTSERRLDLEQKQKILDDAIKEKKTAQDAYDKEKEGADKDRKTELDRRLAQLDAPPGLADRERALAEVADAQSSVRDTQWVARGLVMLVDIAPILLKIMSPKTPYERNLRKHVQMDAVIRDSHLLVRRTDAEAEAEQQAELNRKTLSRKGSHDLLLLDQRYLLADDAARRKTDLDLRREIARHVNTIREEKLDPLDDPGFLADRLDRAAPGSEEGDDSEDSGPATERRPAQGAETALVVNQRWRLGKELKAAGGSEKGNGPYLARDVRDTSLMPSRFVVKRVLMPDQPVVHRDEIRELVSFPIGEEISRHVTVVTDAGMDPKFGYFVVTPYYASGTLHQLIRDSGQQLTLSAAITITEQVLLGLKAAFDHQNSNRVHFDIKPSNIVFHDTGEACIIDWGLSQASNAQYEDDSDRTHGYTLWYAPPEQVVARENGDKNWKSPRCDLRALGAVLYKMITGFAPLYVEAWREGLLDDQGRLQRSEKDAFIALLTSTEPVSLEAYCGQVEGWDARGLKDLSNLVSRWLSLTPSDRVDTNALPVHESALRALRTVVETLQETAPDLVHEKVGKDVFPVPEHIERATPDKDPAASADHENTFVSGRRS